MDNKQNKRGNKSQQQNKGTREYGNTRTNKNYSKGKYDGSVEYGSNPVEWYISNDQLAKDTASLPYSVLTGRLLPIRQKYGSDNFGHSAFPGICKIDFATSVGRSVSGSSAINTASRSIYAWVRHQNSGHSNYEAPDLTIYIMAMMEVYAAYFEAVRVYDLAMTYKLTNRYMPKYVLQALGINYNNISANLAQYRAGLNLVAAKISSLAVPNNFTTFNRHAMLLSNVFMDCDSDRGQYYVFSRSHYRKYNATGTTGGYLQTFTYDALKANSDGLTYNQLISNLNDMIDPILSDEDMNIMSGDILKAYDMSNLYVIPGVSEDRTIQAVYDESVLAQIENAICVNMPGLVEEATVSKRADTITDLDISQKSGYIYHAPVVKASGDLAEKVDSYYQYSILDNYVLNCHTKDPDYKFNIEATRLQNVLLRSDTADGEYNVHCGTEILMGITYYTIQTSADTGDDVLFLTSSPIRGSLISITNSNDWPVKSDDVIPLLSVVSNFDWHPFIYLVDAWHGGAASAGNLDVIRAPIGDAKVYAVNSIDTIKSIHECVLLSQFRTKLLS